MHYDYRFPLKLPATLEEGSFDLVVADPPFLSKECLSKTAQTIKYLTKDKVILCTGIIIMYVGQLVHVSNYVAASDCSLKQQQQKK